MLTQIDFNESEEIKINNYKIKHFVSKQTAIKEMIKSYKEVKDDK